MATLKKLYSDLDLTFNRVPVKGDVALGYDEQSVIRSVRNLLLTNFFERPFQSNIGSNLNKLLFEPVNSLTAGLLENDIKNVIANYEPRATIDSINVSPNEDENAYNVMLQFYIGNNTMPTAVNLLLERSR
jgi:phage baseplate assembly protein W